MTINHPASRRRPTRRRTVLVGIVGFLVLVVVPCVFYPADVARLAGRTETVPATVIDQSATHSNRGTAGGSTSPWFHHFTLRWVDDAGVERTGDSAVVLRRGSSQPLPAPGDEVSAEWLPGTDLITVATLGQSITNVFWPFIAALGALLVGVVVSRVRRWTAIALARGRNQR